MLAATEEVSDGEVSNWCSLHQALETGNANPPPLTIPLPGRTQPVPYFFVANDAFAMRHYIIKPHPFKYQPATNWIFNYWLSRACRIAENVFGMLPNRVSVLRKPLKTVNTVPAFWVLHNFPILTHWSWSSYLQPGLLDIEEFFMTPQGKIIWRHTHIWFHSYNTHIFFWSRKLPAAPLWLNLQNVIYNKVSTDFFMQVKCLFFSN
jgi:hypothetical protein